ncbi:hypothetical protein [Cohnella sp. GCM10012308]|uniref:DUF7662 domain-containing protein n=1 Tax=Cohnella sp. GCM10012308 TaxID=3317329 RepID=UPI00360F8619
MITFDDSLVTLSMHQNEEIIVFALPASATNHRAWWANDITHSQAKAWLLADWEVDAVFLPKISSRNWRD